MLANVSMPDLVDCVNPSDLVAIARETVGTPTAKLIAVLTALGIASTADLAAILGVGKRAVQKVRATSELQFANSSSGVANCSSVDANSSSAKTNHSSAQPSRARVEGKPFGFSYYEERVDPPLSPPVGGNRETGHNFWSQAFARPSDAPEIAFDGQTITLSGSAHGEWLAEFDNDERALRLALVEVAGSIQTGSRQAIPAQVSRHLARIARQRGEQTKRYREACERNAAQRRPANGQSAYERLQELAAAQRAAREGAVA